jgi:type VI secretion system protein ImpE
VNINDLLEAGKLAEAITAATDAVRQQPTDPGRRVVLAELLCFTGALERADNHLDAVAHDDPAVMAGIQAVRHLIRGEQARQEFFTAGRVPSFRSRPEGALRALLEASVRLREGAAEEAVRMLEGVEAQRVQVSGTCKGKAFHDFRDLDDMTCCVIEIITSRGDYYWIPIEQIDALEFQAPTRLRDLLWRRTHMTVRDGPDAEVFLPVLYPGAAQEQDEQLRLGRATDWRGGGTTPTRGVGQRTFLVGDEAIPILELESVEFEPLEAAPPAAG